MKFLVLIVFIKTVLLADSFTFIVDNTTMVDVYYNIFNAIATIFGEANYLGVLKLAFLSGGFFVFMAAVLKDASKSIQEFTKYMFIGTTILTLTFAHKSDIEIKTNSLPTYCSNTSSSITSGTVVGNIPTSFAFVAATANKIGAEMTSLSKSSFSALTNNTSALSRSDFAQSLDGIGKIMTTSISQIDSQSGNQSDSTIGENFVSITNDCILIPAGQDNTFGPLVMDTFKRTGNTQATMTDLILNGTVVKYLNPTDLIGTLIEPSITLGGIEPKNLLTTVHGEVLTCEAAMLRLNTKLDALKYSGTIECMNQFSDSLTPTTLQVLTGSNLGSPEMGSIILNVALANQISESKRNLANINEMSYATTKSMVEVSLQSKASGNYLAEMLPYLQTGMRAILYAFFPFIFIVILLPGGSKVLFSYLKSIIWIELWTPAAAILDMFLNIEATNKMSNLYTVNGLNPMSMFQVFSDANMLAGVAGYLYASVPAITWLILNSSGEALGNIGSGFMGGMTGSGHGSIVEKNLDSRTQNEDRTRIKQSQLAGVSISKFESNEANHKAQQNAGAWLTNQSHSGDLVNVGKGEALGDILQGNSIQRNFGSKEGEAVFAAGAAHKYTGEKTRLKELGVMPGTNALPVEPINQDKSTKIGTILGKEEMQKVEILGATQEKTGSGAGKTKEEIEAAQKRVATIKSTTENADLIANEAIQNHVGPNADVKLGSQAGLAKVETFEQFNAKIAEVRRENPNMKSDGEAVVAVATIDGLKAGHTIAETKEQMDVYAGKWHKGTIGKDGKLHYDKQGYENILKNKTKAVNSEAQTQLGDNQAAITENQRRIGSRDAIQNQNANDLSINKFNKNTLKAAVASGDAASIALEKELGRKNKKGQPLYGEAAKSMARASFIKTDLGRLGDVFSKVESSSKAKESINQGINAVKSGTMDAQILKEDVMANKELLKQIFLQAFNTNPTTGKLTLDRNNAGYKSIRKTMSSLGLGDKGIMSLSNTESSAVAQTSIALLGNSTEGLNTTADFLTTNKLQHDKMTAAKVSDMEVSKTEVSESHMRTIIDAIQGAGEDGGYTMSRAEANHIYGEFKAYKEVGDGIATTLSLLLEGLSTMRPRNNKVTSLKESLIEKQRSKSVVDTKVSENNKRIAAINEEMKSSSANKQSLQNELKAIAEDNKKLLTESKELKANIKSVSSEIKEFTKTDIDKIKENFRPLSEVEKSYKIELEQKAAAKIESARVANEMKKIAIEAEKNAKPNLMKPEGTASKVASGGLKVLGTAAIGYTVYEGYNEGTARYNKGDTTGAAIVSGKTAAIIAGGIYGAEVGATGAAIAGSFVPILGTAVGGFVGGVVGGAIGAGTAAWAGDSALEMYDKKK